MITKTLFIGSGIFAVDILKGLLSSSGIEIVGIITQPDKPAGRKKILSHCPVADYAFMQANSSKLQIFQPEQLKSRAEEIIEKTKPELVIVADYGQIVPDSIINYPKYKCLNVHGSLLPDLRGAVPIPMAILKGYTETGVSIPIMTSKLDDGAIIAFQKEQIKPDDTTESLKARLAIIGSVLLVKTIPAWVAENIKLIPQDESKATYVWQKDISKDKAQITPSTLIDLADRMIRGFYPWPIAWCKVIDNRQKEFIVKIIRAKKIDTTLEDFKEISVNTFVKHHKKLYLSLSDGILEILLLQVEAKKIIPGTEGLFLDSSKCAF
jgi:methionyl-tRNA formyltransferase